jgi:hypothetical protein
MATHAREERAMSMRLDAKIANTGTRFRIFPQPRFLESFKKPEVLVVSVPPSHMQPGPADDRMFVIDAINKKPYADGEAPPYLGPANPPVRPGPDGHFDKLDPNGREFQCATMYATVRRVLDIWEDYFQRRIEWHFRLDFDRLLLIPLIDWDNAQSGYGFLEFGFARNSLHGIDRTKPYCENFDVLAHELGHGIIFSEVGIPSTEASLTDQYLGFHESCGDLVAITSSLHFHSVVDHLLAHSKGNLFSVNELSRVGELSKRQQIRTAFNWERMSTVSTEPHDLSQPMTGAIFDILVEVFQKELIRSGLITQDLADRSYHTAGSDAADTEVQRAFETAYNKHPEGFKQALLVARDYLGSLLAHAWNGLSPENLAYSQVGLALLAADRSIAEGANQQTIRESFQWREITLPAHSIAFRTRRLTDCGLRSEEVGNGAHALDRQSGGRREFAGVR